MALEDVKESQKFTILRIETTPRTELLPAPGTLAVMNVAFLVSNASSPVEDLLVGLPALQHLCVKPKTLLEEHQNPPDSADCSSVVAATTGLLSGKAIQLMIARYNRVANDAVDPVAQHDQDWPPDSFYNARKALVLFLTHHF